MTNATQAAVAEEVSFILEKPVLKCRDDVEHVLQNFPDAREDRRILLFRVLERYDLVLTDEQWEKVRNLPYQVETIRRTAAKIQNDEGRWKPKRYI